MLTSVLIISFSLVLLVYWFRYCCLLLLRNSQEQLAAEPVDNRFAVATVIEGLRGDEQLDRLHQALDRDYQVFTYLVEHAAGLELGSFENRLLLLDYKLMQSWYRITLAASPKLARQALTEMASILGVLVHKVSCQAGLDVEA